MKIVFTQTARADLEDIGDYVAQDNPRRALRFVRELRATVLELAQNPRAFPPVPRRERCKIRCCPISHYPIFYCIEANRLVIVPILHGARDEPLLFPEA